MSYERQYYTNGDVLDARQMNHMETGIKENSDNIDKLSEENAELKGDIANSFEFVKSKNLIDQNSYRRGYINVNADPINFIEDDSVYTYDEFVPVKPNDIIYSYYSDKSNYDRKTIGSIGRFYFYDKNKKYVSRVMDSESAVVPSDCYFAKFAKQSSMVDLQTRDYMFCIGIRKKYYPYFESHYEPIDVVNIKLRGASEDNDIRDIILSIIEDKKTVYIPIGLWKSRYTILESPFNIVGQNGQYIDKDESIINVSAIVPYDVKQNHLFFIETHSFSLKNITFTSKISGTYNETLGSIIKIANSKYGYVDCCFSLCKGNGLIISDSWELNFGRLLFRDFIGTSDCIRINKTNTSTNESQLYFENVEFEACYGKLINSISGTAHVVFNNILCEGTIFTDGTTVDYDDNEDYIDIPYFDITSAYGVVFKNISFNNIQHAPYSLKSEDNTNRYLRKTIFNVTDAYGQIILNVDSLIIDDINVCDMYLIKSNRPTVNYPFMAVFKNVINGSVNNSLLVDGGNLNPLITNIIQKTTL